MRIIERRMTHLEERMAMRPEDWASARYDEAELSMLAAALRLFRVDLTEVNSTYSTAFLLAEAADHLAQRDPKLPVEELVRELRARALLLEQAPEPEPDHGDPT
jgi:hypothetical protein